jgi:hypothetical protein
MFSIYSSAFNLIKNNFDYIESINNFCRFADEVVIAVNKSEDNTFEALNSLNLNNLKLIETDFSYQDPLLDGKIKNEALQVTKEEFKIGLDMDEYIPLWQKDIWTNLAYQLRFDIYDCYMIPSINLYKDKDHYFSIGHKWYLHKGNLFRGAVNFAKNQNGTVDTSRSDTCELIDSSGNLVSSKMFDNDINSLRSKIVPFVVHNGYLNLQDRVLRNKNFWKEHWKIESGGTEPKHKIHESLEDFNENFYNHLLDL